MMKQLLSAAFVVAFATAERKIEQIRPGVFRIPLKKHHVPEHLAHPQLHAEHPRVGNWSDAELWDRQVKNPISNLDSYMYTMDCMLGSNYQASRCIFDTTTSVSSTFKPGFNTYSTVFFDSESSDTFTDLGVTSQFWSIGLQWTGWQSKDTWCLGDGDVHTTVCLDQQKFIYTTSVMSYYKRPWDPPLKDYDNVNAIFGLGKDPDLDPLNEYNFINRAYE